MVNDPAGEKAIEARHAHDRRISRPVHVRARRAENASLEPSRSTYTCSTRSSSRNSAPARSTRSRARRSRRVHGELKVTPFQANRVLAVIGSMYAFAGRSGIVAEGMNPARRIEQFKEHRRERFLTSGGVGSDLGRSHPPAETKGIPWDVGTNESRRPNTCPRQRTVSSKIGPFAAAAIRLLLFTGCRLREILHLKWEQVDLERGLLFLSDSKTGRKTVILNVSALAVLTGLDRLGSYVVPGDNPEKPRADLKRPWEAVAKRAGLDGVRLHDLRHTYAVLACRL